MYLRLVIVQIIKICPALLCQRHILTTFGDLAQVHSLDQRVLFIGELSQDLQHRRFSESHTQASTHCNGMKASRHVSGYSTLSRVQSHESAKFLPRRGFYMFSCCAPINPSSHSSSKLTRAIPTHRVPGSEHWYPNDVSVASSQRVGNSEICKCTVSQNQNSCMAVTLSAVQEFASHLAEWTHHHGVSPSSVLRIKVSSRRARAHEQLIVHSPSLLQQLPMRRPCKSRQRAQTDVNSKYDLFHSIR